MKHQNSLQAQLMTSHKPQKPHAAF